MNTFRPGETSYEESTKGQAPVPSEIPEYPVSQEEYIPVPQAQQEYQQQPVARTEYAPQHQEIAPQPVLQVEETVPQSSTPELQTPIERYTSREGELAFRNMELGQSTFKGGVTSQQLVSKISGYYTVNQGLVNDPHSGLLKQTASSGDPSQATTWQATMLFKILQVFWKALGISV